MGLTVKQMEAQLALWRTRVDKLTAMAEKRGPISGFAMRQQIDDLKAKCALTQSRIDKIRVARP